MDENGRVYHVMLGDVIGGNLFYQDFSKEQLEEKKKAHAGCCGYYPTMEEKMRIWLTFDEKLIMGDIQGSHSEDSDNLYFGPFYFNRGKLGKNNAELTKLDKVGFGNLRVTITTYNENEKTCEFQKNYYLEKTDGEIYKISSSLKKNTKVISFQENRNRFLVNSKRNDPFALAADHLKVK